jgi:uncharacterized membrane protein
LRLLPVPPQPAEARFEFLLYMAANKPPDHYHAADGRIVDGPPPGADAPHDPVTGQLSPEDLAIFRQVADSVKGRLAAVDQRAQQVRDAARVAGTLPDRQQSKALGVERQATLKTGLAELQARLSADGWQAVERFLKEPAGPADGGILVDAIQ